MHKFDDDEARVVIAGAGKAGLIAALGVCLDAAAKGVTDRKVLLVDPAPNAGGSFASFQTEDGALFDRGVHLIPEVAGGLFKNYFTAEEGFDDAFWRRLEFPLRDRHGALIEGGMWHNSSLIDIAALPEALRECIRTEFFDATPKPAAECDSADAYMRANFGPTFADYIDPYFKSIFERSADELPVTVFTFAPLGRLIVADIEQTLQLMAQEKFSERIGFPDQGALPEEYAPKTANYYPRSAGVGQVIDRMTASATRRGAQFALGAKIAAVDLDADGAVAACHLEHGDERCTVKCSNLIWTAPCFHLKRLLTAGGSDASWVPLGAPPTRAIEFAHFVTDRPLFSGPAFYYYDLQPSAVFRITNYAGYTDHPSKNAYSLEFTAPFAAPPRSVEAVTAETRAFLDGIGAADVKIERLWADPLRLPMPPFELNAPRPTQSDRARCAPRNLHLFGSTANRKFALTRSLYGDASDLIESLI